MDRVCRFLSEPGELIEATRHYSFDAVTQQNLIARAADIAGAWPTMSPVRLRVVLMTLVCKIVASLTLVELRTSARRIAMLLGVLPPAADADEDEPDLVLRVPAKLRRAGQEIMLRLDPGNAGRAIPNRSLIKLIVRAHLFHARLINKGGGRFGDLAREEALNRSYFSRILRLAYLAPDITHAILEGRQPAHLTAARLTDDPDLPLTWPEQRQALGFL